MKALIVSAFPERLPALMEELESFGHTDVEVIESPGDHVTIIREPHVATLAKRLDELLERVDEHDQLH